ncbi:hypothetical protein [Sanguibacter sp. HDW7]|uniref:hypothetical protein n=1 Tax=Sanguibacter sp. HDW7 TaxID=2714931 RepID=UPI00140D8F59|nr:hypothetical protein [Sanguibacter sp. HDW7]QIK82278.1 hypothetical protein G7063_00575 [Sanguibacter sp. HDW7]
MYYADGSALRLSVVGSDYPFLPGEDPGPAEHAEAWRAWLSEHAGEVAVTEMGLSAAKSAAIPLGWEARDSVRLLGDRLTVLRIPDQAFPVAAMVGGVVPSVDAVHLGVAVADPEIDTIVTYEKQTAQLARMYGLAVLAPGLPDHWWA